MPRSLYCWRCDAVLPMLTEEEYARVVASLDVGSSPVLLKLAAAMEDPRPNLRPKALQVYHEITGFEETNINAVLHHRISLYGPPCTICEKPLRSPAATYCVACGAPRELPDS